MRYVRADTKPTARCQTCGEAVLWLRWGHEERCAAFVGRRRRRRAAAGVALLAAAAALLALPAHAHAQQEEQIAGGRVSQHGVRR